MPDLYAWEDYGHTGSLSVTGETPRERFDSEISDPTVIEVLAEIEDEAGNILVIVKHIEDEVIGAWLFVNE